MPAKALFPTKVTFTDSRSSGLNKSLGGTIQPSIIHTDGNYRTTASHGDGILLVKRFWMTLGTGDIILNRVLDHQKGFFEQWNSMHDERIIRKKISREAGFRGNYRR